MDDVDLEMSIKNGWIRLGERSREESIMIGSGNENHKIELAGSVQRFVPRIQGPHEEDGPVMGKKLRTIHSLTEESQSLEPLDIAVVAPIASGRTAAWSASAHLAISLFKARLQCSVPGSSW